MPRLVTAQWLEFCKLFLFITFAVALARFLFESPAAEPTATLLAPDLLGARVQQICATVTHIFVPDALESLVLPDCLSESMQCIVFEEGTSHFIDDGWAETQNKISEVSESSQVFMSM